MFASTPGSRLFPSSSNGPTSAPGFRETLSTTSSFRPTRESARVTQHRTRLQVKPYGSSRTGRFETGRNSLTSTRTRVPWAFRREQYSRNVSQPSPPNRRLLGPRDLDWVRTLTPRSLRRERTKRNEAGSLAIFSGGTTPFCVTIPFAKRRATEVQGYAVVRAMAETRRRLSNLSNTEYVISLLLP